MSILGKTLYEGDLGSFLIQTPPCGRLGQLQRKGSCMDKSPGEASRLVSRQQAEEMPFGTHLAMALPEF